MDRALSEWEAFASTGRTGLPHPGRIVFHPRSDPSAPGRVLEVDGNQALAERRVAMASHDELRAWLAQATPLP